MKTFAQSLILRQGTRREWLKEVGALGALSAVSALSIAPGTSGLALAQESYPTKPITLVVPYPPGGNTDVVARAFALPLSKALGQPIVVENKGGAGGAIGATQVAKSAADGYTMVIGDVGLLCINPLANPALSYDPQRDFAPISTIASVSIVIAGRKDLPANNLREFLALAKANPGKYQCATAGSGTIGHLSLELIKSLSGVDILHVPYKGGAPALNDLLGGHVDILIDGVAFNSAKNGVVKALGVTGSRLASLPEVPTVAESGVSGFYFSNFWGFLMPTHTPSSVISRVGIEIQKIAAMPAVRSQLEAGGLMAQSSTDKEFADMIKRSSEQIAKIVKSSGITLS
jgi:tripartite-type tricarboxylate transporter receptor subunit TctC